jgi:NitT/TauT family transport system substrate-binding protein
MRRFLSLIAVFVVSAAHADVLTFQPIFFDARSSEISRPSREALSRVHSLLKANPDAKLTLQGHAGSEGEGVDPSELSKKRADATKAYLEKLGVASDRLLIEGKADSMMLNRKNLSARENRRVEFVFSAKEAADSGKKLEEIEVVYWNTLYHSLYQMGVSQGYFEREGFKVKLLATNHSYSDQVKHACGLEPFMKEGVTVFSGAVCGGSPHEAIAKGVPLVVIGGMLAGGSMLTAKPELAKKLRSDAKAFKGISIGRPRGTVLTSMIVSWYLSKNGLDPKKDVKWRLFDSHEEILEAIGKGTIDAGDTYAPLHIVGKKKYGLEIAFNTVELFPFHPCCRIITTQSKLRQNREKYVSFLKAVIRSHEFFIKQPIKAIDVITQYTGYPKDEVRDTLTNANFILNPDPLKNGFVKFWHMMNETGFIHSNLDINKYIDTSVYKDALESLQKDEPKNPYYAYMLKQFKEQNS